MKMPQGHVIKPEDVKFGPEIASDFQRRRDADGRVWAEGYTQDELDRAQEKFALRFPPDLIGLFLERRPVCGWDWRTDELKIRAMLEAPCKGLIFDVEQNGLWWPEWGSRPTQANERAEIVRDVVRQAPKLVPLVSHRYIPCEPNEAGNPVFSVYQSDVIYYGVHLDDYFERELGNGAPPITAPIRHIRFWSVLVERAHEDPFYRGDATG